MQIPFVEMKDFLVLKATIDGVTELNLLLDTGAPIIALFDSPAVARLSLDVRQAERMSTSTDASVITAQRADGLDVDFNGLILRNQSVAVIPLASSPCENLIRASGIDGLVGYDLLRRYVVQIDFDRDVLTLYEPASFVPPTDQISIPMRLRSLKPVIDAKWTDSLGTEHAVALHLDTGSSFELTLHANGRPEFAPPAGASSLPSSCMLGGLVDRSDGGQTTLSSGDVVWRAIATSHVVSVDDPWDGVVGARAFANYNLVIDYPGERLFLSRRRPGASSAAPQ